MDLETQLKTGKERIAVRIINDINVRTGYAHIVLDVLYVKPNAMSKERSMGFYDNFYSDKHHYKGLQIQCQMDPRSDAPYAFKLGLAHYGSEHISLSEAQDMVKTLRPIERKMMKIIDEEGHCDSFDEYAVRFSRVVKASAFFYKNNQDQYERCDHIGLLRSRIKTTVADNIAVLQEKQAS